LAHEPIIIPWRIGLCIHRSPWRGVVIDQSKGIKGASEHFIADRLALIEQA
jgi:hypothetical protein